MKYSPESLIAFVTAVELGSFSAAARKLKKSQSSVSIAISNFEDDLGFEIFDRSHKHPRLNSAGTGVLKYVHNILDVVSKLDSFAAQLNHDVEPMLSIVMSDASNLVFNGNIAAQFEKQFPYTELSFGPAEDADVIDTLQRGQAHIGILPTQHHYPEDICVLRLPLNIKFDIFVSHTHQLLTQNKLSMADLRSERQLKIKTLMQQFVAQTGNAWYAPDYLTLLELASQGFGWAELPCTLVEKFGQQKLQALSIQGYSKIVEIDLIWSRNINLGKSAQWLIEQLMTTTPTRTLK